MYKDDLLQSSIGAGTGFVTKLTPKHQQTAHHFLNTKNTAAIIIRNPTM